MIKIYLACPYSHQDKEIMHKRYVSATHMAGLLMRKGKNVFSPITHSHQMAYTGNLPVTWDYWEPIDSSYINDWADELWVYTLSGWRESTGVSAEINLAKKLNKKIVYIDADMITSTVPPGVNNENHKDA